MFVYHFVDPYLRAEKAENGGVDFRIGDIGISAHLY